MKKAGARNRAPAIGVFIAERNRNRCYPANQFMGVTGEYIYTGKRSTGMYFVKIDGRRWLGPYEAVKRYRRLVDSTTSEAAEWSVLGEITDLTMEVPEAGESKVGGPVYAFVVEPLALYVPGHVMASYDAEHETGGAFAGESELPALKESWYTEKTVPEETKITVVKGYSDESGLDSYFLSKEEQEKIASRYGEKIEYASVQTVAFDRDGRQLGSPVKRNLIRKNGGRWYVRDYEIRF